MSRIVGANAERSRSHNRQVVLGHVRSAGQTGRAEIARLSGLSTQAVSNIIADLLDDGLIVEQGRRSGMRGLPAVQYALNPEGGYALGVEIRPDAVFAALMNLGGDVVYSRRSPLSSSDPSGVMTLVSTLKQQAFEATRVDGDRVLGAGIVMPGPFGATGIRDSGSELPGWEHLDPRACLSDALGLPVFVENDANAAAMAESISGAAQGLESYAFLYFGTGLGLGLVHQGRIMAGALGNAGEIGHIPVPSGGRSVLLEDAVSRLSAQRHLSRQGITATSGEDLERLYAAGEPLIMEWLESAAEPLAAAITIVENLFDPQTIILGGAMPVPILDHLIGAVSLAERSVANRADRTAPRLMRGASGRMTATLGAAALVINQVFTPKIAVAH